MTLAVDGWTRRRMLLAALLAVMFASEVDFPALSCDRKGVTGIVVTAR